MCISMSGLEAPPERVEGRIHDKLESPWIPGLK